MALIAHFLSALDAPDQAYTAGGPQESSPGSERAASLFLLPLGAAIKLRLLPCTRPIRVDPGPHLQIYLLIWAWTCQVGITRLWLTGYCLQTNSWLAHLTSQLALGPASPLWTCLEVTGMCLVLATAPARPALLTSTQGTGPLLVRSPLQPPSYHTLPSGNSWCSLLPDTNFFKTASITAGGKYCLANLQEGVCEVSIGRWIKEPRIHCQRLFENLTISHTQEVGLKILNWHRIGESILFQIQNDLKE